MEEEPAMAVPNTEQEQDFIIEQEDLRNEEGEKKKEDTLTVIPDKTQTIDFSDKEFDLSDISHKEKSREEIIAEAEAAAFSED
jgi:ribonuclease-3